MKANPFLVGGAVAGAGLLAVLLKSLLGQQKDPQSRLISTLPTSTMAGMFQGVDKKSAGQAVRAFLPQQQAPQIPFAPAAPRAASMPQASP